MENDQDHEERVPVKCANCGEMWSVNLGTSIWHIRNESCPKCDPTAFVDEGDGFAEG